MDAEPILLPKIWQDRCHFRVRTRDAISLLIGSNSRGGHWVYPRTQKENTAANFGAIWRPHWVIESGQPWGFSQKNGCILPADEGWPNTGGYGFSPRQTARPRTLLLYAH